MWDSFSIDPRIRVSRNSSYIVTIAALRETPRSPNLCPKHTVMSTLAAMELLVPLSTPHSENGSETRFQTATIALPWPQNFLFLTA